MTAAPRSRRCRRTGDRSVTSRRVPGPGTRDPGFLRSGDDAPVRVRDARRRGAHRARSAGHRDADHDGGSPHAASTPATATQPIDALTLERDNVTGLPRDELVNPVTAAVLWTAMFLAVARRAAPDLLPRSVPDRFPWIRRRAALARHSPPSVSSSRRSPRPCSHFGEHGREGRLLALPLVFVVLFAVVCQLVGRRRELRSAVLRPWRVPRRAT